MQPTRQTPFIQCKVRGPVRKAKSGNPFRGFGTAVSTDATEIPRPDLKIRKRFVALVEKAILKGFQA
jgi:hypothetical protein